MGATITTVSGLIISKFMPQHNRKIEKKYFSPLVRRFIDDADVPPSYESVTKEMVVLSEKQTE